MSDNIHLFNESSIDQDNREIRLSHIEVIDVITNNSLSVVGGSRILNLQQLTNTLTNT